MNVDDLFRGLEVDREFVVEFFVFFARFEYALKEAGYVFDQRGYASPDWKSYERDIGAQFGEPSKTEAVVIGGLIADPPMVQKFIANRIEWKAMALKGTPIARAIAAARQVRNNLFHGGKHSPHSPPERDQQLVTWSLALLKMCLARKPAIMDKFNEPQRN